MSLRDAMRKAAGLLIEMPEGEGNEASSAASAGSAGGADVSDAELDSLLSGIDKTRSGTAGGAHSASPYTPVTARTGAPGTGARVPGAGGGPSKTVEQVVRDSHGPNLDEIKVADPAVAAGGSIDCSAIYQAAKLPKAPFSAEQMLDMLASLPSELPLDTKRQTVKVTLGALGQSMGATPESIVADASRKLAALAAYTDHLTKRTSEFAAQSEKEIAELEAKIEEKRKGVLDARHKLAELSKMCEAESGRLDDVLEFFSLDLPPSKYAATGEAGATPGTASNAPRVPPGTPASGLPTMPANAAGRQTLPGGMQQPHTKPLD